MYRVKRFKIVHSISCPFNRRLATVKTEFYALHFVLLPPFQSKNSECPGLHYGPLMDVWWFIKSTIKATRWLKLVGLLTFNVGLFLLLRLSICTKGVEAGWTLVVGCFFTDLFLKPSKSDCRMAFHVLLIWRTPDGSFEVLLLSGFCQVHWIEPLSTHFSISKMVRKLCLQHFLRRCRHHLSHYFDLQHFMRFERRVGGFKLGGFYTALTTYYYKRR